MGKVIHVEIPKATTEGGFSSEPVCNSPIVIQRPSRYTATIGFRKDCFNLFLLDPLLRGLLRGQNQWKLYRVEHDYSPDHIAYMIQVNNNLPDEEAEAMMREVLGTMAEKVYAHEVCANPRHVNVPELEVPHRYSVEDDVVINEQTSKALREAGFDNLVELVMQTREDVCRIYGMTTQEVFQLEKSLASRGLYLLASKIPEWKELARTAN